MTCDQIVSGNCKIPIVFDHFTRLVEALFISNERAETIAHLYATGIICRYGVLKRILTYQETNFMSDLMASVHSLLGTTRLRTTTYYPHANTVVERANGTLRGILRKYADGYTGDWDNWLPVAAFSYNTSPHGSLGDNPHFLNHVQDLLLPLDVLFDVPETPAEVRPEAYKDNVSLKFRKSFELVREFPAAKQERAKARRAEKVQSPAQIKTGDLVYTDISQTL